MTTESTGRELTHTGISVIGDVRWGTHFCYFYETKQDLLDTQTLYFKAGLENNEFCLWVVSQALSVEEAKDALALQVPDLDRHLAEGNLEIRTHDEWYLRDGRWDPQRVLESWGEKLARTTNGYAGSRAAGDGGWIQIDDWMAFREYEKQVNALIADQRSIILCTYPLTATPGNQVFDVAHIHEVAVAKRNGNWEVIEIPELKEAKAEIKRLNQELEQKVEARTNELAGANEELKRQIIERKELEQQAQALIDAIPHQIWSGRADGTLDYCNDRWRAYMGLDLEDLRGDGWQRMLHPEDRDRVLKAWHEAVVNGTPYEQEERHRAADGAYRWFLARGVPWRDAEGRIVRWYGTNTDIEDRKQAEEALRESEIKFRRLLASNIIGVVFWTLEGDILETNDLFLNMVGYTREDLRQGDLCWKKLTPPEYAQVDEKAIGELTATGTCAPFEKEYIRKDGSRISVLIGSALLEPKKDAGSSFVMDITERKEAEEQLRRSEEKFKALFGIAPVGISLLDREHNIVDANPALEQITRLSREKLLSTTRLRRAILKADGTPMLPHEFPSERAMTENRLVNDVEAGIVTENGEIIWVQESVAPLTLPDASAVVITQDITQRKRAAEALEEANRQLRILSRQLFHIQEEERRHLARELHDEIGQTLTAAKINLKIIAPDVPAKVGSRLEDSIQLLDRLLTQVRQLSLDLRPPLLDELGLVPTLRWLVDQQAQRAGLRVTFSANVNGLEIDPDAQTACFRVAQEAITNIIRHSGARSVAVELRREAERLWLSVRDDGAGFEPTATQHSTLGLVSMKERALLVRGGLEVHSAPGQGTEIRAWFPLARRDPSATETA
jgi:PAS domain S-box-containing protein